ncbi:MAG: class I SAM-dependent methyltransferase [Leptospiraceae bacterium]|nr:class I SAM-dependent methyltransferase [Leptospiraceae bacterium]
MLEINFGTWEIVIKRSSPELVDLQVMYSKAAKTWHDSVSRLGFMNAYENLFMTLKNEGELDKLKPNSNILDAGIGTGALSVSLLNVFQQELEIHGVDICEKMIRKAEKNLRVKNQNNFLRISSAENLSYPNESFDLIISAHLIEHYSNPVGIIQELSRVLKKDGLLIIITSKLGKLNGFHSLKWRYNSIPKETIHNIMNSSGIGSIKEYSLDSQKFFLPNQMSMAYLGRKSK